MNKFLFFRLKPTEADWIRLKPISLDNPRHLSIPLDTSRQSSASISFNRLQSASVKKIVLCLLAFAALAANAKPFTGPDAWQSVNTNAIAKWQAEQQKKSSDKIRVWKGVAADAQKREVKLLAEAVGHAEGVTTEFLLIGPNSDRAYESAMVSVALPSDIVKAMEHIGLPRGGGIHSRPFRFWPMGERVQATVRFVGSTTTPSAPRPPLLEEGDSRNKSPSSRRGGAEGDGVVDSVFPLQSLIKDTSPEPLIGNGGLVFTGGRWSNDACLTDTRNPGAIMSLYNDPDTIFDVPFQASQGAVYGRASLAKAMPYGEVMEITLTPLPSKDGKPWVKQVHVPMTAGVDDFSSVSLSLLSDVHSDGSYTSTDRHFKNLAAVLDWMKREEAEGRDLFVTLHMCGIVPLAKAVEVAQVFCMLDGKGIKLNGKLDGSVYPRAFLPQEKWREREGRMPQPFEIHITKNADGTFARKLTFIEEDWTVEGLDPKLTPTDYPFTDWNELPALVQKVGGEDSKVELLFVFAPKDEPLSTFMPAVRALEKRLPLVYIFAD